ncbi:alpha/beta hydrolase [Lactococcus lactis]|uniref:alpha/beta hydrolase n=1 Tax=Lactococcus lactis TaxID=1358 RepID=UPI002416C80E|nr:alpha/beta hydrolase [Lactococcus lactis]MDG4957510.1 alpha/beta hydrolase [Lactococcus lactis]
MKIFKRIFVSVLILLIISFVTIAIIFQLSPKPMSYLVRKQFDTTGKDQIYQRPIDFKKIKQSISIYENQLYDSDYNNHTMDIYSPKNLNKKTPVLFWMHGGAYVGGDKRDVKDYLEMLSGRAGIIVVNINYALAPETKYPVPVRQLNEAISMVKEQTNLNIDWDNVYLGGDSAGAQIASEYLISLIDSKVANSDAIKPVIQNSQVKKFISLSGLLEPTGLTKVSDKVSSIMFKACGWSYFGQKDFMSSKELDRINLKTYASQLSQKFFLTDGNSGSFMNQAQELSHALRLSHVAVTQVFYDKKIEKLGHEYQFDFSLKQANETFEKIVAFVKVS